MCEHEKAYAKLQITLRSTQDDTERYRTATLHYFEDTLAWLKVRGNKKPFEATGHFPIRAGYDTFGKERYIALVVNPVDRGKFYFTFVTDGSRAASFIDWDDNLRAEHVFYVLVLQYDPSDMGPPHPSIPEDALDQTGPVYWTYSEFEEEIKESSEDGNSEGELPNFYIVEFATEVRTDGIHRLRPLPTARSAFRRLEDLPSGLSTFLESLPQFPSQS